MRKTRDEILAKTSPGFLGTMSWPEARRWLQGNETHREYDDDYFQKQAQALADRLTKAFGRELSRYPEVLWRALEIYDITLQDTFCDYHGYSMDHDEGIDSISEEFTEKEANDHNDF